MYKITLLFFVFYSLPVFSFECKKVQWLYKREQNTRDLHAIFQLNTFESNLNYLVFEVSRKNRSELEKALFKYLAFHAKNDNVSGFIKAMEWVRLDKGGRVRAIEPSSFCSLYKKTLAIDM